MSFGGALGGGSKRAVLAKWLLTTYGEDGTEKEEGA